MELTRLAEALRAHTAGFANAVAGAEPDLPVPTCPDWPLRVLAGHIGQAHRWSAEVVRSGASPVPDPREADPGAPDEWAEWLRAGAAELVEAVTAADRPVWTFFGEAPARFWLRRMLHDTVVHHADAAFATGAAFDVAADIAADGLDEWLELVANPIAASIKPAFAELRGTGQTLQLHAADGDGWLITRTPEGVRWKRRAGSADVTLAGPVRDLLLVFTRRLPADRVTITGDHELAEHWLARMVA